MTDMPMLTVEAIQKMLAEAKNERDTYESAVRDGSPRNKYIEEGINNDLHNLGAMLIDSIKPGTIYRCINNLLPTLNTKSGLNHYVVMKVENGAVFLNGTFEEDDETLSAAIPAHQFWDMFEHGQD